MVILVSHLSGVIPKDIMDSMKFLINFHFLKDINAKKGNTKSNAFKGKMKLTKI